MRSRILLVEDNPDLAVMLAELLRVHGFDSEIAEDGLAALERLDDAEFDLVISDLQMPKLDGYGFFRALARRHPSYLERLVFITGSTDGDGAFLRSTTLPVLHKPFEFADLDRLIRQKLSGRISRVSAG